MIQFVHWDNMVGLLLGAFYDRGIEYVVTRDWGDEFVILRRDEVEIST